MTLRRRADFLRAAAGRRAGAEGLLLQAVDRQDPGAPARVGITCSRKLGNAVTRNRAKRRLRALARTVLAPAAQPGWDYVLVGRPGATVSRSWAALCNDLAAALARVHAPPPPRRAAPAAPPSAGDRAAPEAAETAAPGAP